VNNDLGLRAGIDFTPDNQCATRKLGAFVHARQAIVPVTPTYVQNLLVDTFPVVQIACAFECDSVLNKRPVLSA